MVILGWRYVIYLGFPAHPEKGGPFERIEDFVERLLVDERGVVGLVAQRFVRDDDLDGEVAAQVGDDVAQGLPTKKKLLLSIQFA